MLHRLTSPAAIAAASFLLGVPSLVTAQKWTQLTPSPAPAARSAHAMSSDFLRRRVVLFGGAIGAAEGNDTWEWDGTKWTQLTTTTQPGVVRHHGLSFDMGRIRTVLFGGRAAAVWSNETWELFAGNWIKAAPTTSPSTRYGHGQGYDMLRRQTIVFGGIGSNIKPYEPDTWAWDGTNWKQLSTTGPVGRIYPAMAFDQSRGVLVMFAGYALGSLNDTWEWDGTNWKQITTTNKPSARWGHAMCYDMASKRIVMHGGSGGSGDTWSYDGTDWTQMSVSPAPSSRQLHMMAYDAASQASLMFGGSVGGGETWSFAFGTPATYSPFGLGCAGSAGVPALDAATGSLPWINSSFTVEVTKIAATSPTLLSLGVSNTTWGAIPLPFKLDPLGAPGCLLLASPDLLFPMVNTAGTASLTLPLPNDNGLVGVRYHNQGLVFDPTANKLGWTTSNGATATIGKK
jgi:hypothetical protein